MQLGKYIQNLLYRHDCVIVPEFGGFIAKQIGARIENESNFFPPSKQLGFNANLKHNDGLLINEVAAAEGIDFNQAKQQIHSAVQHWNVKLQSEKLLLDGIGSLQLNNEKELEFEPLNEINYLNSSYGLSSFSASIQKREETKVIALAPERKGVSVLVKYAATAAVVLTLGALGWQGYEQKQIQKEYAEKQEEIQQKIQSATFVIENPLPTVELNLTKEVNKPFHVVAGSFQFEENAEKKVKLLKKKGYNAYILGKNKWGLTQVAYDSYADRYEAYKNLAAVRKADSKEAWLLVKSFK